MIHIVNGDIVGKKLKGLNHDDIIVWREMYDFGPFHTSWSNEELINNRAIFFENKLKLPSSLFITNSHNQLKQLANIQKDQEVVLWFEHDRYDQTMLMYIITQLYHHNITNLSMVSINSYPSITPFYGLGQLTSEQLAMLYHKRVELSHQQINEALNGWETYTSSNLNDVKRWISENHHELPFLGDMFKRQLSYYPVNKTGLNEIETLLLKTIALNPISFKELYQSVSPFFINDGLSDLHISAILNELTVGSKPLIKTDDLLPNYNSSYLETNLTITPNGENVLLGKENRIELIGIDWWVGGVHLKVGK